MLTTSVREKVLLEILCKSEHLTVGIYLQLGPAVGQLLGEKLNSALIVWILGCGLLHTVIDPVHFPSWAGGAPMPGYLQVVTRAQQFRLKPAAHHNLSSKLCFILELLSLNSEQDCREITQNCIKINVNGLQCLYYITIIMEEGKSNYIC